MKITLKNLSISCFRKALFLIAIVFSITNVAYACDTGGAFTSSVTLQAGTWSAGQDMPVSTIVRIQRVNAGNPQTPYCTSPSTLLFKTEGGTLYPGATNIYQTGIDGLGVRFRSLQRTSGLFFGPGAADFSGTVNPNGFSFDMEFIVMGPISGGTATSNAFPTLKVLARDGYNGVFTLATYTFSGGSFNVQVPTCTTPNYNYNLGTYGLSNFSGGTQVSPWIDTPITLTGCATFYGNNSNGSLTATNQTGGSPVDRSTLAANTLKITLNPNTTVIDSAKGIVSLDSGSSASGIAIQVGNGQSGLYVPLSLSEGITLKTTPGVAKDSYIVPVGARIVRSTGDLAAGSVSTSFVYTVSYN